MSSLQLFNYEHHEVRTILIDGEPWFVLNDLCKVLEIANPYNVVDRLDSEYLRKTEVLDGRGISRETNIVNESGMYEVVIRSNAPTAAMFRKWLVAEVLPAIRKTGSYGQVAPTGQELLALAVVEAQQLLAAKNQTIAVLEPKASAWDDLVSSAGSLSFRDAAKVISEEGGVTIGGNRLIQVLTDWRWVFRPPATPEEVEKGKQRSIRAYQTQIDAQTLTEKAKQYTDQATGVKMLSNNPQTRVTGKGLDRIRTRLLAEAETATKELF